MKINNIHERTFRVVAGLWLISAAGIALASARMPLGPSAELPNYAGEATVEVVAEAEGVPRNRPKQPRRTDGPEGGSEPAVTASRSGGEARARQEEALATYRAEVKQEIGRWLEQGSAKAAMKAYWEAPSTQSAIAQTGAWTIGVANEGLIKMGLRWIASPASRTMLGFTSIWSFMDGLAGIEKLSLQNNQQLKQTLEQSAAKYWETIHAE